MLGISLGRVLPHLLRRWPFRGGLLCVEAHLRQPGCSLRSSASSVDFRVWASEVLCFWSLISFKRLACVLRIVTSRLVSWSTLKRLASRRLYAAPHFSLAQGSGFLPGRSTNDAENRWFLPSKLKPHNARVPRIPLVALNSSPKNKRLLLGASVGHPHRLGPQRGTLASEFVVFLVD